MATRCSPRFRERQPALREAIEEARSRSLPVIYVNDSHDAWAPLGRALRT
jgi:hypothetical protein